jgi:nitroreductase
MGLLDLDPDVLLSTTRAVRKRLDFSRPVPDDLIRECVALALQAPSGSNVVTMGFVVVTDADKRQAIGQIYGELFASYASQRVIDDGPGRTQQQRLISSSNYLAEHMGDAPALVIGVNVGKDRAAATRGMGNILPAMWSFMLAARARALGTAWTTIHLGRELEVAELLGIPYETVAQAVMTPVAYSIGTDFKPADRPAPADVIHWNGW